MAPVGNGVGVLGLGEFLPDEVRTNDWWPAAWRERHAERIQQDLLASVDQAAASGASEVDLEVRRYAGPYFADLFRGVKERRVMDPAMKPSDMETAAARAALAHAGVAPDEIDAVLGYSVVTDAAEIENAPVVARNLGLRRDVTTLQVSGACSSFVQQLRMASLLVASGECQKVLIVVSAATSTINDYTSPSSVVPGDGAVAAVVGRVGDGLGYVGSHTLTFGEFHDAIMLVRRDGTHETPWWCAEGGPFLMKRVDGRAAHFTGTRAASVFRDTVTPLLHKAGVRPEDLDFLVVSQASAWFGRALADAIGVDHAKTLAPEDQYEKVGHLMAGSVAYNLLAAERLGKLRRGGLVLVYSPGLGFVTTATLVRWGLGT